MAPISLMTMGWDNLLEVISWLDNASVVSLIKAYPELQRKTVFITDHDMAPIHFDIPDGVERQYLPITQFVFEDLDPRKMYSYANSKSKEIRLIEIFYPEYLQYSFVREQIFADKSYTAFIKIAGEGGPDKPVCLNATSFIFFRDHSPSWCAGGEVVFENVIARLEEYTRCKYVIGSPTRFITTSSQEQQDNWYVIWTPIELRGQYTAGVCTHGDGMTSGLNPECLQRLQTLRLELQCSFKDHNFPELKELAVIFSGYDGVPELANLSAPNLFRLVVHYDSCPPLMYNIAPVSEKYPNSGSDAEFEYGVFEIAHTPFTQLEQSPFARDVSGYAVEEAKYSTMDMSFTGNFTTHHYIGAPNFIVEACDQSLVTIMRWHIVAPIQSATSVIAINAPKLDRLSVLLQGSGASFPYISCPWLAILRVSIRTTKVDLKHLWELDTPYLVRFHAHKLFALARKEGPLMVDRSQWEAFANRSEVSLRHITLEGVDISTFEISDSANGPAIREKIELDRERFERLGEYYQRKRLRNVSAPLEYVLRPYVPAGKHAIEIPLSISRIRCRDTEPLFDLCSSVKFNIKPVFQDPRDARKVDVFFRGVVPLCASEIILTSTSDWRGVHLEGIQLSKNATATEGQVNEPSTDSWKVNVMAWVSCSTVPENQANDFEGSYTYTPSMY